MTIHEMRCLYPNYAAKERDLERLQQEVNRSLDPGSGSSWLLGCSTTCSATSTINTPSAN